MGNDRLRKKISSLQEKILNEEVCKQKLTHEANDKLHKFNKESMQMRERFKNRLELLKNHNEVSCVSVE